MSALYRFLAADGNTQAFLTSVLAGAVLGTIIHAQPAAGTDPAALLVTTSGQARQAEGLAATLREGTRRCLADQGRVLSDVAGGAGNEVLLRRANELAADRDGDRAMAAGRTLVANGVMPAEARERLASHLDLRQACLEWGTRTIASLGGGMIAGGEVLERARQSAARDRIRADIAIEHLDGDATEANQVEAMETFAWRL